MKDITYLNLESKQLKDLPTEVQLDIFSCYLSNKGEDCINKEYTLEEVTPNGNLSISSIYSLKRNGIYRIVRNNTQKTKIKFNWENINPTWKYIAKDYDGAIYMYSHKPEYIPYKKEWCTEGVCREVSVIFKIEGYLEVRPEDSLIERK